jgi:hypothetical protein
VFRLPPDNDNLTLALTRGYPNLLKMDLAFIKDFVVDFFFNFKSFFLVMKCYKLCVKNMVIMMFTSSLILNYK